MSRASASEIPNLVFPKYDAGSPTQHVLSLANDRYKVLRSFARFIYYTRAAKTDSLRSSLQKMSRHEEHEEVSS